MDHSVVVALFSHQLLVCADLGNFATIDDSDDVSILDVGHAMGYDDGGTICERVCKRVCEREKEKRREGGKEREREREEKRREGGERERERRDGGREEREGERERREGRRKTEREEGNFTGLPLYPCLNN